MKISPYTHTRTKRRVWVLDFGLVAQPDGSKKRVRQFYKTRDLETRAYNDAKAKRALRGDLAFSGMSEGERARLCEARDKLAERGFTIEQAVTFFLSHQKPLAAPVLLPVLLKDCLEEKERGGCRDRYRAQLKSSCKAFIRGREHLHAHEVTRDEVEKWIQGNQWAPKTQRVYLGDLRTLF